MVIALVLAEAATAAAEVATGWQKVGAFCFGLVVGWYLYYVNRHRKGEVQLGDLATVVGAVGGGAVLALFPAKTDLFAWYGMGLAAGFFAYFVVLVILVSRSKDFTVEFLLDGRRTLPDGTIGWPDKPDTPMARGGGSGGDRGDALPPGLGG